MEDKLNENIDRALQEAERKAKTKEQAFLRAKKQERKRDLIQQITKLTAIRFAMNEYYKAQRIKSYDNYSKQIREKREQLDRILIDLNPL